MELLMQNQVNLKCQKHNKNEIIYIQVNELEENKCIFYCEACVSIDYYFKPSNYVRIKQVLDFNDQSIVFSWPPLNDNNLQQQLIQLSTKEQVYQNILSKDVVTFFEELKMQLLHKINVCQTKAINLVQEFPNIEKHIIQEYQKISKINTFKDLFLDQKTNLQQKEALCKSFINEFIRQKDKNTQFFQQIFNEQDKLKQAINLDALDQIRKQMLQIIDQYFDSNAFSLQQFSNNLRSLKQIQKNEPQQNQNHEIQIINQQISYYNQQINQPIKIQEDLLSKIQFIQSIYCEDKYDRLKIAVNQDNNQIELATQNVKIGWSGCYYTNLIFDRNQDYIIRFRVRQKYNYKKAEMQLGLASNAQYDKFFPYDNLSCLMQFFENKISISDINQGIAKVIKGDLKNISSNEDLQLKVSINQGILELSDINQNNVIGLLDKYKQKLSLQNLRFFVQLNCYSILSILQFINIQG
ncbi:hypothetical protein TTHERM_000370709 (macronuclear) [Tetrahymena thermophila SB210]|uniref:Zinc carboxypeptidase family protein n=1 Tax=Tetrahymena thermophila (strain SB210) TaxID=312017 RepID=W7XGD8_TETTS|nr:hypothetical protein TTHERM_000370709 [Tetrahymena thermophila SB210]EWS76023.1 hypothetical protein TTHERM_000370709 [Tetrahymena thermophila SB210]|eukprot:XP_012651461.1 hypothetical protein TTHERM_000370709 [Tetrahymena thermophila SB210]